MIIISVVEIESKERKAKTRKEKDWIRGKYQFKKIIMQKIKKKREEERRKTHPG